MSGIFPKAASLATATLLLSACQTVTSPSSCEQAGDDCVRFSILHSNDHHGRFWRNRHDEYGMAARKTLVDTQRRAIVEGGGQSLLLSGGDINTGVPESDMQDAVPDFIGMNLIGYDAMAVGNHEFDNDISVLRMQREMAQFPMLAANIYLKNQDGQVTDERLFEPYRVFDVNGVTLAVVGMTTKDTAHLVHPDNVAAFYFADPVTEMPGVIAELKQEHPEVELVFALTHMGHFANGKHGSEAPGDVAMARALPPGQLHGVIGGHSQNPVCMEPGTGEYADFKPGDDCLPDRQNGTWIMQAYEWGKYLGRADFGYYQGQLELLDYQLIPVNLKVKDEQGERRLVGERIEEDAQVLQTLASYQQTGQQLLDQNIALTQVYLDGGRDNVRNQQTNLGQLIGAAFRSHDLVNADFAVVNAGGIRAGIEQGDISYRDILTVQPFGNFITRASMQGAELQTYLNKVGALTGGGYAQLNNIELDMNCDAGVADIRFVAGSPFSLEQVYTFAISGFSAAGGDGYPVIDVIDTQQTDADMFKTYLEAHQVITGEDIKPGGVRYFKAGQEVSSCAG